MGGNSIPVILTRAELERGIPMLQDTITPERFQRGVPIVHVHGSGSEWIGNVFLRAHRNGFRMARDYQNFSSTIFSYPGSLTSYLKASHLIDETQAGIEAFRDAVQASFLHLISTEGTVPAIAGDVGSVENPLFPVRYLFWRFNPMKRTARTFDGSDTLVDVDAIVDEVAHAVARFAISHSDVKIGIIFCFARELVAEINAKLAAKIPRWASKYACVVAVDIAGPEDRHTELLEEVGGRPYLPRLYGDAANGRLAKTIHCGETQYVSGKVLQRSIELYKPHQIAHPISAFHELCEGDDTAMSAIAEAKLLVEFCPWSNMISGAIKSASQFGRMLAEFDRFGIPYMFSTDNPANQRTTLALELIWLLVHGAATPEQIERAFQVADNCEFVKRLNAQMASA